jgi:hypothetical protein
MLLKAIIIYKYNYKILCSIVHIALTPPTDYSIYELIMNVKKRANLYNPELFANKFKTTQLFVNQYKTINHSLIAQYALIPQTD